MRIALGIEYNGRGFYGWQKQHRLITIEGMLEAALSRVANEPIKLFCAGRTDAGVHAIGQVVHFDTNSMRLLQAWTIGANTYLPSTITIRWAKEVDNHFHARYTATSRCYQYIIYNNAIRSALMAEHTTWHRDPLDIHLMQQAGQYLIGEHDFSSFRAAECTSKTAMRNVHFIHVTRQADFVIIEIQANAFLHHMVRNVAGVLMHIGGGRAKPAWAEEVLLAKDRRSAHKTALPNGLYLYKVNYPKKYRFPDNNLSFDLRAKHELV